MNRPVSDKIPVLLFARVSSEAQQYDYQIAELQDYCKKKDYEVVEIIANNISGRSGNRRPDIDQLFQIAKAKKFQKVIITSMERLGRDAKMIRRTIDFLHQMKISIVFKNQNFESLDSNGEESFITNMLISIYSEICQEDNRQRSIKIKSGMLNAVKNKGVVGGRPAGWKKDHEKLLKEYAKLAKDLKNGLSLNQCVKLHEISKNTVIKVKKALSTCVW